MKSGEKQNKTSNALQHHTLISFQEVQNNLSGHLSPLTLARSLKRTTATVLADSGEKEGRHQLLSG